MTQETPLPAGLAKRLAEAADGFRDGLYHYFLAVFEHPYYLVCTPGSDKKEDALMQAKNRLKDLKLEFPDRNYDVYGPYLTSSDQEIDIDYDMIEIRMIQKPSIIVKTLTLENIDAIVFNRSAFDKFFLPYYLRLYGPEKALEISNNANTMLAASKAAPHQYCTICEGVSD